MAEYIREGEMVEGKKCSVSARRMEFKKGGLRKDPITNKYYLSNRLFTLSQNWEQDNKLTSDFMRIGNTIEHQCNELINLHLPHSIDSSILTARILPSNRNLRVDYPIGATFSAVQSSAGKCLICEQDDLLLKRIFEYHHSNTPSLNQDCNNFITEIHKIQQMGYAFNLEEVEKGVCSIGAPIRNAKGSIIAALNFVVPQIRFTEERTKRTSPFNKLFSEISFYVTSTNE